MDTQQYSFHCSDLCCNGNPFTNNSIVQADLISSSFSWFAAVVAATEFVAASAIVVPFSLPMSDSQLSDNGKPGIIYHSVMQIQTLKSKGEHISWPWTLTLLLFSWTTIDLGYSPENNAVQLWLFSKLFLCLAQPVNSHSSRTTRICLPTGLPKKLGISLGQAWYYWM